ncbi:hypothetical protein [Oceanobacillus halotolerans]|uniref:hypothetical protein n=1 Tax=Oceanobacillus halotolerans TaxID=2663380 RepID=UPI0013D90C00|nr:hypothetical protein [Oceanobacillus halotolerans]
MAKKATENNVEKFSSQLSAKIWGHRFTDGQRGPEYVLEFLNVLVGADYNLGSEKYLRNKSLGLRRFIFEGVKEGSKRSIVKLETDERQKLIETIQDENSLDAIQEFLRNLEVPLYDGRGKAADRSWYARTLYPLHEALLYFEVRKKGDDTAYERNFFARGGELYFLMLYYGTEKNLETREKIERRFRKLLTKNVPIEKIVTSINEALDYNSTITSERPAYLYQTEEAKGETPYLPVLDHPFYKQFAEELATLIDNDIDIYELFPLLTSLITFQLMRYMYDRAKVSNEQKIDFFFDCIDGQEQQILKLASSSFQKNDLLIKDKFEKSFKSNFEEKLSDINDIEEELTKWKEKPHDFLSLMGLTRLQSRKKTVERALQQCNSQEDIRGKLYNTVKDVVSDQLKRHQLSIIKILVRDGGLGGYRTGTKYRYFMSDNFLQTLVYINVGPGETKEFSDFLESLYQKYNIIIGEKAARDNGLYEKSSINISYYQKNEQALREKLKKNGLLIEYSDATAMIRNPYGASEV